VTITDTVQKRGTTMKKLWSFAIATALGCCLCGTPVLGATGSDPAESPDKSQPVVAKNETQRNEKLRTDVLKMVSDAKAGKLKVPAPQFPAPTHRNNLSKGAKIAIGAGIAGAIIFAILWHTKGPGSD
jgi:hypothetical protein